MGTSIYTYTMLALDVKMTTALIGNQEWPFALRRFAQDNTLNLEMFLATVGEG